MAKLGKKLATILALALLIAIISTGFSAPSFTAEISPEIVSTNQNVTFSVTIQNTGSETITDVVMPFSSFTSGVITYASCPYSNFHETIISGEGLNALICSASGGTGITAGGSALLVVNISSAPGSVPQTNPVEIPVSAYNSTGGITSGQVYVTVENEISISAEVSTPLPQRAVSGQTGLSATFRVDNNGDAVALSVNPNISILAPYQSITPSITAGGNINGGSFRNYISNFNIPSGTSPGTLTLRFNATGIDENSLFTDFTSETSFTTVYSPPIVNVYSITTNASFVSTNSEHSVARLSVVVGIPGSPSTISNANISLATIRIVSGTGADDSSGYTSPLRTDSVTELVPGMNATLTFDVRTTNPSEGQKFANFTINYYDGISGQILNQSVLNNRTIFAVDRTSPQVSVLSISSTANIQNFFRQGETISINSSVADTFSGISSPLCDVFIGGIYAGTLPLVANRCEGSVNVPEHPSLYGSENVEVRVKDSVGNEGTGTKAISIYTLVVNATDALTGADIKEGTDFSNATAVAFNSSGGNHFSCTTLFGTKSQLCGVPLGTIVNVSLSSPAYVTNNRTLDASRICVGIGDLSSCSENLPSGGANTISIALVPNTRIIILNEFNQSILMGNVTVKDSATTPWYKPFIDGGSFDSDGTVNGSVIAPIDTGKHTSPFDIRANLDSPFNPGYLQATNSGYVPSQASQTTLTLRQKFTILVRVFDEFNSPILTSTGSVSFTNANGTTQCVQNHANLSEYGCPVMTVSENPHLLSGGNVTVAKPGYVTKKLTGIVPPADTQSSQIALSTNLDFNLGVRVLDQFGNLSLTTTEIERVYVQSGNCTYSGGSWGCAAVAGDEVGITILPRPSSGYLRRVSQTVPFVDYVKSNVNITIPYTLLLSARDELSRSINGTNVSSVTFLFGAGISCRMNSTASPSWGCPVPAGTASAGIWVNVSQASGRMNQLLSAQSIPSDVFGNQTTVYSSNNFTLRVLPLTEFGNQLPLSGLAVAWNSEACIQSGAYWYCPAPAESLANIYSRADGFIDFLNSSVTAPAVSGTRTELNTSNKYSILIGTFDEFSTPRNFSSGSVSFAGVACQVNPLSPYYWGCPILGGTSGQGRIAKEGFVNHTTGTIVAQFGNGTQGILSSANQFTLKATIYDELGSNFSSGVVLASNSTCEQFISAPNNTYFCQARPPDSALTIAKAGFETSSYYVSGLSDASQTAVTINGTGSPKYSAVITVRRNPSSGDESALAGAIFLNSTTRAQIIPSWSSGNRYYFSLEAGNNSLLINKSGYVEKLYSFLTTPAAQHSGEAIIDYSLRVEIISENGTGVRGATLSSSSGTPFIEANSAPSYYSAIDSGTYSVQMRKAGFVTTSPQAFSINTTYPSNQTLVRLTPLYTLKIISLDWGGAPLNGTTAKATGQAEFTGTSNVIYFEANPLTTPTADVNVSKSGYNTVSANGIPISNSSQNVTFTYHAQQISARAAGWDNSPIDGAVLRLHYNGTEIASCTTGSYGNCTFLSTNGASNDSYFNSSEIGLASNITVSAEKSGGYYRATSLGEAYYYQNSTSPLSIGTVRIGIPPRIRAVQAWNASLPVVGATVVLSNSTGAIASNSTDSEGYAVFIPDFLSAPSQSDYLISGTEAVQGTLYFDISMLGYSPASGNFYFNASEQVNMTVPMNDSQAPLVSLGFSGRNGSAHVKFENFNLSIYLDEVYSGDSSGIDYSLSHYNITWENGTLVRGPVNLSVCPSQAPIGGLCNLTGVNGWDLPVGNLTVNLFAKDIQGNSNSTNIPFVSEPGINETFILMERASASNYGGDFFLVTWGLVVKGTQGKLQISNLEPINCTSCPPFPISGWASLLYNDVAGCEGAKKQAQVRNTWPLGQTPAAFCDYSPGTRYAREQNVTLKILLPTGLSNAKYNATYLWKGMYEDLPPTNLTIVGVNASTLSPEAGENFTVTAIVYATPGASSADEVVVGLNSSEGSPIYSAGIGALSLSNLIFEKNATIPQIYSGQYGHANFIVTANSLGSDIFVAEILSAIDSNTGYPLTLYQGAVHFANNSSITIVDTRPPIAHLGASPANNANLSSGTVQFLTTGTDSFELDYLAIYGNWSGAWGARLLNSTPFNNTQWTATGALPDGHFAWAVYANDTSGNSNITQNRTLTVDTTAPVSAITAPANNTYSIDTTPDLSGTAADATSGVRRVWVRANAGAWAIASGTTSWSYTSGALSDGTYVFQSKAEDWAGNNQSSYGEIYFTVDTTSPESFSYVSPTPANEANLSRTYFEINSTFTEINPASCSAEINGANYSASLSPGSPAYCFYNATGLPAGTYLYRVWAEDLASNWGVSASLVANLDSVLPSAILGTSPANALATSQTAITFDIIGTDNSNLHSIAIYGNFSGTWSIASLNSTPFNASWWNETIVLSDGTYSWGAFANDSAGNSAFSANRTLTIDTISPASFSYVSPTPANEANLSRTYFEINSTFTEINPASCSAEINGANYSASLSPGSPAYCFYNNTGPLIGIYTYRIYATDSAGNVGASSSRNVNLDTIAPEFSSQGSNVTEINGSAGEVANLFALWYDADLGLSNATISTNETGSFVNSTTVPLTGSLEWSDFEWTNSTPLPNGTAVAWRIWGSDIAGNWNVTDDMIITVLT